MVVELVRACEVGVRVWIEAADPLTLAGLRAALDAGPEVAVADDPRTADVAVFAVRRIDRPALARVKELRDGYDVRAVLVVEDLDDAGLLAAVEVGVAGVQLREETSPADLERAAVLAGQGDGVMSPALVRRLLDAMERLAHDSLRPQGLSLLGLSEREVKVLRLLADGCDTAEVAARLNYSTRTIKAIVAQIVNRLDVRNRTQAVAYAIRTGLI